MSKEANKAPRSVGAVYLLLARSPSLWSSPAAWRSSSELSYMSRGKRRGGILQHQVSVALKASRRTRFNVQCLMVWCELLHSQIKSNQVLPLGAGPEPKSTKSPGWALVQIVSHHHSEQRANPSESVFQQPHDELCIPLSYYLVFSFDLSAVLWPRLREVRGNCMNFNVLAHE